MSFLNQDEGLIDLAAKVQLVYSPLADIKAFPKDVDIALVEGAVGNEEQLHLVKEVRTRTKVLVALGDCAVTGNVTALRNALSDSAKSVIQRAYLETADVNPQEPTDVPKLLEHAHPLHEIVEVDCFVPGCPPAADLINYVLTQLLSGETPRIEGRFRYG